MEIMFNMVIAAYESLMFREMSLGKLRRRHGSADLSVWSPLIQRPTPLSPPTDAPITCNAMLIGKRENKLLFFLLSA